MRHLKAGRKFGRNPSNRRAMLRNLTANLITHERIKTTDAKAKEVRRVAEKLITKAKRLGEVAFVRPEKDASPDRIAKRLHVARQLRAYLPRFGYVAQKDGDPKPIDLIEKILIDLAKRFQGRPGGYTRIIKLGPRRGDNAPMSFIELLRENEQGHKARNPKPSETAPSAETKEHEIASEGASATTESSTHNQESPTETTSDAPPQDSDSPSVEVPTSAPNAEAN